MLNIEVLFPIPRNTSVRKACNPLQTELRRERVQIFVALITKIFKKLSEIWPNRIQLCHRLLVSINASFKKRLCPLLCESSERTNQSVFQMPCFTGSTNTSSLCSAFTRWNPKPRMQQVGIIALVVGQSKAQERRAVALLGLSLRLVNPCSTSQLPSCTDGEQRRHCRGRVEASPEVQSCRYSCKSLAALKPHSLFSQQVFPSLGLSTKSSLSQPFGLNFLSITACQICLFILPVLTLIFPFSYKIPVSKYSLHYVQAFPPSPLLHPTVCQYLSFTVPALVLLST